MNPTLHALVGISMYAFVLTSLFGVGLSLTVQEIIEPLKKTKLVFLSLLANFVLIPAAAYGLTILLKAGPSLQTGLLILACCAGAPTLPKFIMLARGNTAHSTGLMVLLMAVTLVYTPVILPVLIPNLSIDSWAIAQRLLFLMFLPLSLGLLVKAWRADIARSIKPVTEKLSSLSMVLLVVLALMLYYKIFVAAYGTGVYNLTVLFTASVLLIGFVFGGSNMHEKLVMMLGAGLRSVEAALIVVIANFSDPKIVTVILIGSLVQFTIIFTFARLYGKYGKAHHQL